MVVISHLAYLLTVVTTTVVLQVGNPALHVFYRLNQGWIFRKILQETCLAVLFVSCVQRGVTARIKGRSALCLHSSGKTVFEDCFTFRLVNCRAVLGERRN